MEFQPERGEKKVLNRLIIILLCAGKRSSKHNQLKAKVARNKTSKMSNINESLRARDKRSLQALILMLQSVFLNFTIFNQFSLFGCLFLYLQDHVQEVLDKWTQIDDEIWAKVIVFERNRRVAKAYARAPVLTVNGSDDGFDGMRWAEFDSIWKCFDW